MHVGWIVGFGVFVVVVVVVVGWRRRGDRLVFFFRLFPAFSSPLLLPISARVYLNLLFVVVVVVVVAVLIFVTSAMTIFIFDSSRPGTRKGAGISRHGGRR